MITNFDELVNSLANNTSRIVLDKGSLANQTAGRYASMWRATGQPAQGAIPGTTPAVCTTATTGAIQFTQQTAPNTSYIALLEVIASNSATTVEVHDRLCHVGGLVLNVTTPQTITGLDLSTIGVSADRIGDPTYGDVQWWLEVYSDGGATASNATISVIFDDGSTGNLNTQAVGGTIRAGNRFSVDALRTGAQQGRNIRAVTGITLSASTGTAGNFGFTATRPRMYLACPLSNLVASASWAGTGLPVIPNDSCLEFMVLSGSTSTGTLRGGGKIIHG